MWDANLANTFQEWSVDFHIHALARSFRNHLLPVTNAWNQSLPWRSLVLQKINPPPDPPTKHSTLSKLPFFCFLWWTKVFCLIQPVPPSGWWRVLSFKPSLETLSAGGQHNDNRVALQWEWRAFTADPRQCCCSIASPLSPRVNGDANRLSWHHPRYLPDYRWASIDLRDIYI